MLDITTQIIRGIIFIRLEGRLTTKTFYKVKEEINYLLYNQGMMAYVFNLEEVKEIDNNLSYSEELFYNGEYKKSLEFTINCLNKVEPDIFDKISMNYN